MTSIEIQYSDIVVRDY